MQHLGLSSNVDEDIDPLHRFVPPTKHELLGGGPFPPGSTASNSGGLLGVVGEREASKAFDSHVSLATDNNQKQSTSSGTTTTNPNPTIETLAAVSSSSPPLSFIGVSNSSAPQYGHHAVPIGHGQQPHIYASFPQAPNMYSSYPAQYAQVYQHPPQFSQVYATGAAAAGSAVINTTTGSNSSAPSSMIQPNNNNNNSKGSAATAVPQQFPTQQVPSEGSSFTGAPTFVHSPHQTFMGPNGGLYQMAAGPQHYSSQMVAYGHPMGHAHPTYAFGGPQQYTFAPAPSMQSMQMLPMHTLMPGAVGASSMFPMAAATVASNTTVAAEKASPNIITSQPHHEETSNLPLFTPRPVASGPLSATNTNTSSSVTREAAADAPVSDLSVTCFSTATAPVHSIQATVSKATGAASTTLTRGSAGGAAVGPESMQVNTTGSQYQQNAALDRLMNRPNMQLALRGGDFSAPNSPRDEHEADGTNPHLSNEKREGEVSAEKARAVAEGSVVLDVCGGAKGTHNTNATLVTDEAHMTLGGWGITNAVPEPVVSRNVYVASMPKHYDDKKLAALFSNFGTIVSAKVMCDHNSRTKESKGYGFVLFQHANNAEDAIKRMGGQLVEGLKIQVRPANMEAVPTARSTHFAAAAVQGQILVNVPETAPDRAPAVVHPTAAPTVRHMMIA